MFSFLAGPTPPLTPVDGDGAYETQFESSMKDKALFKIANGELQIFAEKREGYTPPKKK